jgi:two-component system, NarL family, invasion response regulator UvrY
MKILFCDDHKIFREGFIKLIENTPGIESIQEAKDGEEALSMLAIQPYDIVLLDISLPGIKGMEVLKIIKQKWPTIRVLIFTGFSFNDIGYEAFSHGAWGFLNKDDKMDTVKEALICVNNGHKYIPPEYAEKIVNHKEYDNSQALYLTLTDKQMEVGMLLAGEKTFQEIADILDKRYSTISSYQSNIVKKLKLKSRTELTLYFKEHHLI